jgi:hypothetical protein
LKRGTGDIPSLDVEVVNPDQLKKNPASVAGKQLPVLLVPATTLGDGNGVDIVVDGKSNLDGQVHDEDTLGTELVRQNLDGVGNEETRPSKSVGDTVQPDEDNVDVANGNLIRLGELLTGDGGADQENKHTASARKCKQNS